MLIQSGIEDERDELLEHIDMLKHFCEETKNTLEGQIQDDEDMLSNAQTKLAAAAEKEATAGETARQTANQNAQLNQDPVRQMKTCSGNNINFENEICALKKIRGELYKMKGGNHSAFFQDCDVAKWDPEQIAANKTAAADNATAQKAAAQKIATQAAGDDDDPKEAHQCRHPSKAG